MARKILKRNEWIKGATPHWLGTAAVSTGALFWFFFIVSEMSGWWVIPQAIFVAMFGMMSALMSLAILKQMGIKPCGKCEGDGAIDGNDCDACKATGWADGKYV